MDDLVAHYVELALEARGQARIVDLQEICAAHPELVPAVARLLRLDDALDGEPASDPLRGSVLNDRYELHDCIGVGAMGAVYNATDRTLHREVAVKLLQNGPFASEEHRQRFVREARVLASLRHPNIVSVYDHGCSAEGLCYIVMERLVGVPLARILSQAELEATSGGQPVDGEWLRRRFNIEVPALGYIPQVVFWCHQVATALLEAHRAGVSHRDVKPTNIFIDEAGGAILLDFGIAAEAGNSSQTATGSTVGSPWYMAPEQVGNRAAKTELVDVYGLCATLYHLVTFRPPYDGDYGEVLQRLATVDPPPPASVRPELSRDLCAVIEMGMERNPARRYASMRELGDDLRALHAQLPVAARPITRIARWMRTIRRRPAPAVAALACVLAVGLTIPVAGWVHAEAAARVESQRERYLGALAALAPSIAFEGSFELRPKLDAAERDGYLAQLGLVLELEPGDLFARLLRSALLLDRGDHAASLAEVQWIVERDDSPFLRALLQRHAAIDTGKAGVLGLDLEGLPEPGSETDRVVLGFQLYRYKRDSEAEEVLAPANSVHARNIRLGALLNLGRSRFRSSGDRGQLEDQLEELLVQVDLVERDLGGKTARTLYFRGAAQLYLDDWESAAVTLELSRRLCPDAYGTNFNLGLARMRASRFDEALPVMLKARSLRPNNLNAGEQIAVILAELGEFDSAISSIERAPRAGHTVEPWHRDFYRGYVEALRAMHLYGECQEEAAAAAEALALAHYHAALEQAADGSNDRATIERNIGFLILHETPPAQRFGKLLHMLEAHEAGGCSACSPTSRLYLAALSTALAQAKGLMDSAPLQQQLAALLARLAKARSRPTPPEAK